MPLPIFKPHLPPKRSYQTIGVASGKGGVGKSTVTVQMALHYQERGMSVGILDGDLYNPSIPHLLTHEQMPSKTDKKLIPAIASGIQVISLAYFQDDQVASILRAPIVNSFIEQFLTIVEWQNIDILLIDFPPGTGDIPITIAQKGGLDSAVLVTTPQELSLKGARRAAALFKKVGVPIMGVIENMTGLFAGSEGEQLASELGVPLLANISFQHDLNRVEMDMGSCITT